MNPFEMVVLIVAIVMVASVTIKRMEFQRKSLPEQQRDRAENDRLRSQVQQLQDRIRVLERIVTDSGTQTAAQIEALRDRDRIAEEDKA